MDDKSQKIHIEHANGMFAKFQQAVIIALTLGICGGLWSMNARMTRVETMMEIMVANQGIRVP